MTTATSTHIFALSPDHRRAVYDEAAERVADEARDIVAETKARKSDPRSIHDYRAYNTMGLVCVLVVKHRKKPSSLECSRDGSAYPHIYLPTSKSIVEPETTDDFALISVPKWLAQKAELIGVTLSLSSARPWTDSQRETWKSLSNLRMGINSKIHFAKRRAASNISRGNAA